MKSLSQPPQRFQGPISHPNQHSPPEAPQPSCPRRGNSPPPQLRWSGAAKDPGVGRHSLQTAEALQLGEM